MEECAYRGKSARLHGSRGGRYQVGKALLSSWKRLNGAWRQGSAGQGETDAPGQRRTACGMTARGTCALACSLVCAWSVDMSALRWLRWLACLLWRGAVVLCCRVSGCRVRRAVTSLVRLSFPRCDQLACNRSRVERPNTNASVFKGLLGAVGHSCAVYPFSPIHEM